ncbi:MAG: L-fucokinase [Spirochaetales bacterium]
MRKLLSLPEGLVPVFHEIEKADPAEWFVDSDPSGLKVGSGGGTAHLLAQDWRRNAASLKFTDYLARTKKIIIHAGGQSRRLPAYAPVGKVLTPIPVFRWSRGQKIDQTLIDLQIPLYQKVLERVGGSQNTLIASGDVLILAPQLPSVLPDVDVLCFGVWVEPKLASRHGVFFTPRESQTTLEFMLQKPSHETLETLATKYLYQMDIGLWILSDRAVALLMQKSGWSGESFSGGNPSFYDLYSAFGPALGSKPTVADKDLNGLSVAIVPLEGGGFYHFGPSRELISSMCKVQDLVQDQRFVWHHRIKPTPSLFVQNSLICQTWTTEHHNIWVENSQVPATWTLSHDHVLTGMVDRSTELRLQTPDYTFGCTGKRFPCRPRAPRSHGRNRLKPTLRPSFGHYQSSLRADQRPNVFEAVARREHRSTSRRA